MTIPPDPNSPDRGLSPQGQYQLLLAQAQQQATPDGILVVDQNNRVKSWNQRLLELWGLDPKVMLGADTQSLLKLTTPCWPSPRSSSAV